MTAGWIRLSCENQRVRQQWVTNWPRAILSLVLANYSENKEVDCLFGHKLVGNQVYVVCLRAPKHLSDEVKQSMKTDVMYVVRE